MFCERVINHKSFNRFYWCIYMLCMYIGAISCWRWAVKWLLRTLLSIWEWISELNLAHCRGNVLIHQQKSVICTNDCLLLGRAGAAVVLALVPSRCLRDIQQQHLGSTEAMEGGKGWPRQQRNSFCSLKSSMCVCMCMWEKENLICGVFLLLFSFWDYT